MKAILLCIEHFRVRISEALSLLMSTFLTMIQRWATFGVQSLTLIASLFLTASVSFSIFKTMNNHILKIRNLRKIKQKLKYYKRRKGSQNPYHPSLNCHIVNSAKLNFKGTYSKLFSHLRVQLEKLEECLRWLPKAVNIPLKSRFQNQKLRLPKELLVVAEGIVISKSGVLIKILKEHI